MALPTTNITTNLVKNALQETTNNITKLCTSNKVNKWSFWKPIESNNSISESILINANDGFSNLEDMKCNTLLGLQNKCISGDNEWLYQPPKTAFRLGDFRSYSHSTTSWFNWVMKDSPSITNAVELYWNGDNMLSKLAQFPIIKNNYDGFGFILYFNNSAYSTKYYHIGTFENSGKYYLLNYSNLLDDNTYLILPCFSNTQGNATPQKCYSLEECNQKGFTFLACDGVPNKRDFISPATQLFKNISAVLYFDSGGRNGTTNRFTGGAFEIFNRNDKDITASIYIQNDAYEEDSRVMYDQTHTIRANSFVSINTSEMDNTTWYTYDDTGGQLRFNVTINANGYSKSKDVVFAFSDNMPMPQTINFTFI